MADSLFLGSERAQYDVASDTWKPRCPHGDECSHCDAVGHCAKGRAEAEVAAMSDDEIVEAMTPSTDDARREQRSIP